MKGCKSTVLPRVLPDSTTSAALRQELSQNTKSKLASIYGSGRLEILYLPHVVVGASFSYGQRPAVRRRDRSNISEVLERSRTEALPSSVTLSNTLCPSWVFPATRRLFHPRSTRCCSIRSLRYCTSRILPVSTERKRIVSLRLGQTRARCEPSGDKLQLQEGSTCDGAELLPCFRSNRNVSVVSPLVTLYRQKFNGRFAHCTFQMPTSLRTRRGTRRRLG